MKFEVTRHVVSDLWPLYKAGEVSPDSRRLVDAFLAEDPAFSGMLQESERLPGALRGVHLSPDAERRLLDDVRQRARTKLLLIGAGIALAGLLGIGAFIALLVFARGF